MNIIGRFCLFGIIYRYVLLIYIVVYCFRLREERCDPDRPLPLDQKARDLSPRNGKFSN